MVGNLDADKYEELLGRAAKGDARAQNKLVEQLYPFLLNRIRTQKALRALPKSEDHAHDVAGRIVKKLFTPAVIAGFVKWRAESHGAHFGNWISTVITREVVSYVRQKAGRKPIAKRGDDKPEISAKLFLNEFATSPLVHELGSRPPITALQQARQLMRFAEQNLPKQQYAALGLWLQGAADDEIDEELGLAKDAGRKLVRSACATLRRRFAGSDEDD